MIRRYGQENYKWIYWNSLQKCLPLWAVSPKDRPYGFEEEQNIGFNYLQISCIMAEYLQSDEKQKIFSKYGKSEKDTGSPESQIALFSYRIDHLTEHVKKNRKDNVTRRALLGLVGKRRQLLDYLQKIDIERYRSIVKALGLRR